MDQISRNMDVYVDDMLVKSTQETDHIVNLEEAFSNLHHHQMKLNSSKCTFGVTGSKFLNFMVTQRGIEANLLINLSIGRPSGGLTCPVNGPSSSINLLKLDFCILRPLFDVWKISSAMDRHYCP